MRAVFAIVFIVAAFAAAPSSVFAAVVNEPYVGVSDAYELLNAVANATCNGKGTCSDSTYATVTSRFFELTDGSSAVTSTAATRSATSTNEKVLSVTYNSLSSLRNGAYYLSILNYDAGTTFVIYPYLDENNVDTTLNVTVTLATATKWYEVNVDSLVRRSAANFGVIKLRIATTGTAATGQRIAELYLKRPVTIQDLQFVPTGTTQVEFNSRASAVWMIFSTIPGVQLQNVSCKFEDLSNGSILNVPYSVFISSSNSTNQLIDPGKFEIYYYVNSTSGFREGMQAEIYCNVTIEGVSFTNVEQIVYVNRLYSIWGAIGEFKIYLLEIMGILRNEVEVLQTSYSSAASSQVLVKVLQNKQPYSAALCNVSLFYPNMTSYMASQQMSYATNGVYKYGWTAPANSDYMVAAATCLFNNTNGNVTWSAIGTLNARDFSSNATAANVNTTQIYEGTPKIMVLQGAGFAGSSSQVLAQLMVGSNSVVNAGCNITIYYPANTTKVVANNVMSYSGDDGMYNYTWIPPMGVAATYPARVSCQGGSLGLMVAQASASIDVEYGVVMQSIG